MSGIEFPVTVKDIKKCEKQNPTISVNVFGYEQNEEEKVEIFPIQITKN